MTRLPAAPKEIHFFDDLWQGGLEDTDIARYHAYFARPEGHLSGEWTPNYMLDAWTPGLLRRAAPEARLLVMLRDPVERFRSERSLAENRFSVGATPRAAANAAFARGLYADQLLRLWSAFPREQTLLLQYERCVADPRSQLLRTYAFLGLQDQADGVDPAEHADARPADARPEPRAALSAWQQDQLRRRYAPENERLADLVADFDLSLWQRPT